MGTHPMPAFVGDWKIVRPLGAGAFAAVFEAAHAKTGRRAAVKSVVRAGDDALLGVQREGEALRWLQHGGPTDGIVRLLDVIHTSTHSHLILELVPGVELFTYLSSQPNGTIEPRRVRPIVRRLLQSLAHMHSRGVLHRDIKLDNIFYDEATGRVTVIDFNLAAFFDPSDPHAGLDDPVGSIHYASPGVLRCAARGDPYPSAGGHLDVWALGVCTYGMLCGVWPFRTENDPALLHDEIWDSCGRLVFYNMEERGAEAELAKDFCRRVLDPRREWTAAELLRHPWMRGAEAPAPEPEKPRLWWSVQEDSGSDTESEISEDTAGRTDGDETAREDDENAAARSSTHATGFLSPHMHGHGHRSPSRDSRGSATAYSPVETARGSFSTSRSDLDLQALAMLTPRTEAPPSPRINEPLPPPPRIDLPEPSLPLPSDLPSLQLPTPPRNARSRSRTATTAAERLCPAAQDFSLRPHAPISAPPSLAGKPCAAAGGVPWCLDPFPLFGYGVNKARAG
ncbi:kinase-like domain-containing protein [Hyaloraphidium curvatum]|nr:kinase-like domain-containing protein [Hyaloraphidium curvatum]